MARYYFHLHECGKLITDDEGRELPDFAAVHREALTGAREIMSAEIKQGKLCLSCHIEVLDEDQRPILILPFREALQLAGV